MRQNSPRVKGPSPNSGISPPPPTRAKIFFKSAPVNALVEETLPGHAISVPGSRSFNQVCASPTGSRSFERASSPERNLWRRSIAMPHKPDRRDRYLGGRSKLAPGGSGCAARALMALHAPGRPDAAQDPPLCPQPVPKKLISAYFGSRTLRRLWRYRLVSWSLRTTIGRGPAGLARLFAVISA
jgi:hypothetical protein